MTRQLGLKTTSRGLSDNGATTMGNSWMHDNSAAAAHAVDSSEIDIMLARAIAEAARGSITAYFDLGVAFSTGSRGAECDLIEAHKWFNLAAVGGHEEAKMCRADVSDEMTAREIAEAQRRAREWIASTARKAA